MIGECAFEKLKKAYGDCASWTIWAQEDSVYPKTGISDLSIFDDIDIGKINTGFVFVGLNAAQHDVDKKIETWSAFHSTDIKRQQDYKLRHALYDTIYWGSYITDIIKCYPETDSKQVMKMLKERHDVLEQNIDKFKEELQLLTNSDYPNPVIVAIGNNAFKILKKYFGDKYTVKKIMHYSAWVNKNVYRDKVLSVLCEDANI